MMRHMARNDERQRADGERIIAGDTGAHLVLTAYRLRIQVDRNSAMLRLAKTGFEGRIAGYGLVLARRRNLTVSRWSAESKTDGPARLASVLSSGLHSA